MGELVMSVTIGRQWVDT